MQQPTPKQPLRGPGGPPPAHQEEEEHHAPLAQSVISKSNSIIEETQELFQIQDVAAQQCQHVMLAAGGGASAGTVRGSGPVKLEAAPAVESQKEALQSSLVQAAGQIIPLALNYALLKSGVVVPAGTIDMLTPILIQAAGAGVATVINNVPFWRGKKQVAKS